MLWITYRKSASLVSPELVEEASPRTWGCQPALLESLRMGAHGLQDAQMDKTWSSYAATALGRPSRVPGTVNTPPHPYSLAPSCASVCHTAVFHHLHDCALEKESQNHRVKWMRIWIWQRAEIVWKPCPLSPCPPGCLPPLPPGARWEKARVARTWRILSHYISLWPRKPFKKLRHNLHAIKKTLLKCTIQGC